MKLLTAGWRMRKMRMRCGRGLLASLALVGCSTLPEPTAVEEVVYLEQNWTPAERDWFYHTSQGTRVLPYSWFLALEQPALGAGPAELFSSTEYLARFGFIADPVSPENPDGLPVGFAQDDQFVDEAGQEIAVVGLTCAACHTGQITYQGRAIRIDGGPAMVDMNQFQRQLVKALGLVSLNPIRFRRFAARVLGSEHGSAARGELRADLKTYLKAGLTEVVQAETNRLYPTAEGFGRLDALGRGGNYVFGTLGSPANLRVADAPVSYPALWGAPWFDWVQYNGSIRQPMARNVAEAAGVRSLVKLSGPVENLYDSTVRIDNLARLEAQLAGAAPGEGLRPPAWPEAVLGPIDQEMADRGAELFQGMCAGCHAARTWTPVDAHGRSYRRLAMLDLEAIGTDPKAATNFAERRAVIDGSTLSAAEGLKKVTSSVIERYYDINHVPAERRVEMNGFRANDWRAPLAYRAPPLHGIWATAPYLHNGSVPSLYQLLLPAERRDKTFHTGSREFDPKRVGYVTSPFRGSFEFRTDLPGNSNSGHEFRSAPKQRGVIGRELTETERWDLIEYLKSL